jgi:hypothetical protein
MGFSVRVPEAGKKELWAWYLTRLAVLFTAHNAADTPNNHRMRAHRPRAGGGLRETVRGNRTVETALAELSSRQIAETADATGLADNTTAKAGGGIARQAHEQLESQTDKSVVSGQNYLAPKPTRRLKAAPKK